jgi:hypothetical protein
MTLLGGQSLESGLTPLSIWVNAAHNLACPQMETFSRIEGWYFCQVDGERH